MRLSGKNSGDPPKEIRPDFVTVDLVEHFVSSTRIEIVGDITDTCGTIALYQGRHTFELLADGIFTPRKHVDRQILANLTKTNWVGQLGRSSEE